MEWSRQERIFDLNSPRSHDRNCVRFFVFHQLYFQFFFTTRWPECSSQQTRVETAGFYYSCSNRKFVPFGTIPSKQTPFFFLSDKCELSAGSDGKKNTTQPAGDRTEVFRLPVGRSNHWSTWATKPRQELRANFCLSPNCQFFFTTRWPEWLNRPQSASDVRADDERRSNRPSPTHRCCLSAIFRPITPYKIGFSESADIGLSF